MAKGNKKRLQSPWFGEASAAKRTRMSNPPNPAIPLSKGEDWDFRVKVISSATNLEGELFRDAIRGLQIVERHMRQENARAINIRRMGEVFRSEMIHRLTSILGTYSNTPDQATQATVEGPRDVPNYGKRRIPDHTFFEELSQKEEHNDILERQRQEIERDDVPSNIDPPVTPMEDVASKPDVILQRRKDRKISSDWQWDIDLSDMSDEAVKSTFLRTADLFAYHALPITKQKLGPKASKKELRLDMQSTIDAMPQDEFVKWIESLEKLVNGDRTILVRSKPPLFIGDGFIKQEPADKTVPQLSCRSLLGRAAIVSPTEHRELETAISSGNEAFENHTRDTQDSENIDSAFSMPVLQLLWGTDNLTPEQCINHSLDIIKKIMENLQRRVPAERIIASGLGGQNKLFTKAGLRSNITQAFSKSGVQFSIMRIKKSIESSLVHWVLAEPKAFPELKAMPFVFAHTVPSMSVVINLLFGSWSAVSELGGSQMWENILEALQGRGISEASVGAANIDCLQIHSLCKDCRYSETTRRALLERILRRLAFLHREKFPELRVTRVVQTWESKTGLSW